MAETALEIIYDAMRSILVIGDEQSVKAVDLMRGIRLLNRMMKAFEAEGIDLSYVAVTAGTDDVDVDDGAYEGIIANLALRMWPYYYKGDPNQIVVLNAARGKKDLYMIAVEVEEMDFPDSLPIGSGNEDGAGTYDDPFFEQEYPV